MPRRVSSPELIGRAQELGVLRDALAAARDGRFTAVFLAGESGVGKSRLVDELATEAEESGARVLVGECVALTDGELPYGPIRAALRPLDTELEALTLPGREELARLLPQLGAPGAPAPGRSATGERLAQGRLFELVLAVLSRLGDEQPVVLAVEDIHWADRSTLDFLAFLIANARGERLALICTYRVDELHRNHPLRPYLARHERRPSVERVELPRLTEAELRAQIAAILGTEANDALARRLYARTEGNPFFTEELLAAVGGEQDLPGSLRDALMLHVDSLSDATQQVLRTAAVHGRVVTHRLIAAATDLHDFELHAALREAVAHHVLVRRDLETFAFRHALLLEALAADLLPGEREAFHLAFAEAIEGDPALVSRDGRAAAHLCAHWLGAHRLPEALAAAVRAGIEAEELYAFTEASHHFLRALDLWARVEDPEAVAGMDEPALQARAAEAASLGDEGALAMRLVRRAIDGLDPAAEPYRAAMLRDQLAHYLWLFAGDDESAQRTYQEAVDLLPADRPRPELARVLASLAQIHMLRGRTSEAIERAEQALAVAREIGAGAAEALALNTLGSTLAFLGDRERAIAFLRESLERSAALGEMDTMARAYVNLAEVLDQDCRLEESAALSLEGAQRAGAVGMRDSRLLLLGEAATRAFKLGRLADADAYTLEALDLQPSLARLVQCAARARVEVQRGHAEAAERLIRAAEEALPRTPATWFEPLASARVEHALLCGRPDDAWTSGADELARRVEREYVVFTARLHALTTRAGAMLAERARASGDEPGARVAADRARRLLEQMGRLLDPGAWRVAPPPEALAHHEACAAECARADGIATAAQWTAVADRWHALGLPLEESYARLREAECGAVAGERAAAERACAAGLALARAAGATWLVEQLEVLARRGRLAVASAEGEAAAPPDDALDRLGLTERERAVLELVAQGLSNREIGEQLFMATKTASVHVSRILAKLDVGSRVEAATAAQRLGLVR